MEYVLHTLIPTPWLVADLVTVLISLLVVAFIIRKARHPVSVILEGFAFVFLYAGLFENFAVVNGWYVYGRSLLMFGDVPLSVPLLEMDVFLVGLWLLQKMNVPDWCKPFLLGLFGMLQDFSLDPVAVRQVFTVNGVTSGRWTWLLEPGMANVLSTIPVYNFPGWMLIMMYAAIYVLLGRRWFRRSGYKPVVGYLYPFLSLMLAMITMVTPISSFLLWLQPFFTKGSQAEWIMLAFHLTFPSLLLLLVWRGRMRSRLSLTRDLPIFAVPVVFHVMDIGAALAGGFSEALPLVAASSAAHIGLLVLVYCLGMRAKAEVSPEVCSIGP
jgi:hypothetical protein